MTMTRTASAVLLLALLCSCEQSVSDTTPPADSGDQTTPTTVAEAETPPAVDPAPIKAPEPEPPKPEPRSPEEGNFMERTEDDWRKILTPQEFDVLRRKGTERAFTGEYWNTKTAGTYSCRGCGTPLFRSDAKYDSGCGWPSFFEPLEGARLEEVRDTSHGMIRTEVICKKCGGHLGHVFNDGPKPTGLRYCINSVSIKLKADEKKGAADAEKKVGPTGDD